MTTVERGPRGPAPVAPRPAVEVRDLAKRFGGTQALRGISFDVAEGGVIALVGPNGSGKTTTLKCVSGFLEPTSGSIRVFGDEVTGCSPQELWRRGIAQTFQRIALAEEMTVTENVLVALDGRSIPRPTRLLVDLLGADRGVDGIDTGTLADALTTLGLEPYADELVATLPLGIRRRVELARALAGRPRILLLDEPASGLDARESAELVSIVRAVHRRLDLTVVIVEHDLEVVAGLADHLVVLDFGEVIAAGGVDETLADERVRSAYLGVGHG